MTQSRRLLVDPRQFVELYFTPSAVLWAFCRIESLIPGPETPSAFHLRGQRKALPHRDASSSPLVRPCESIAETQLQLNPALLRLSAMISQCFRPTIDSSHPPAHQIRRRITRRKGRGRVLHAVARASECGARRDFWATWLSCINPSRRAVRHNLDGDSFCLRARLVMRSQSGRLLVHIKLSKPDGK